MKSATLTALIALGCLAACSGCVERRIVVRSDPPGAPVWIDEQYAGLTPLDWSFAHYGWRRVRVGPLRDEGGRISHAEQEVEVPVRPPWYERFPLDFFSEVLYPRTLVDDHRLDLFRLEPAPQVPALYSDEQVEDLVDDAEAFRERARGGAVEMELESEPVAR